MSCVIRRSVTTVSTSRSSFKSPTAKISLQRREQTANLSWPIFTYMIALGTSVSNYTKYDNLFSVGTTSPCLYFGTLGVSKGARGATVG